MLTTFNDDIDLLKKVITDDESWVHSYDIKTKAQIIPMEAFRRGKIERSTTSSVKCEGFVHCFLRLKWRGKSWILAIVLVVRPIGNATLKLCTDCAKQFVRNAQNCGKTNHGFAAMITHQLIHQCLCVCVWSKIKP